MDPPDEIECNICLVVLPSEKEKCLENKSNIDSSNSSKSPNNSKRIVTRSVSAHIQAKDSNKVAILHPCTHSFHNCCIKRWAEQANSCPNCRQKFNKVSIRDYISGPDLSFYTVKDKKQRVSEEYVSGFYSMSLPNPPEPQNSPFEHCLICDSSEREFELLTCDCCEVSYHSSCLGLESVPSGSWYCPPCMSEILQWRHSAIRRGDMRYLGASLDRTAATASLDHIASSLSTASLTAMAGNYSILLDRLSRRFRSTATNNNLFSPSTTSTLNSVWSRVSRRGRRRIETNNDNENININNSNTLSSIRNISPSSTDSTSFSGDSSPTRQSQLLPEEESLAWNMLEEAKIEASTNSTSSQSFQSFTANSNYSLRSSSSLNSITNSVSASSRLIRLSRETPVGTASPQSIRSSATSSLSLINGSSNSCGISSSSSSSNIESEAVNTTQRKFKRPSRRRREISNNNEGPSNRNSNVFDNRRPSPAENSSNNNSSPKEDNNSSGLIGQLLNTIRQAQPPPIRFSTSLDTPSSSAVKSAPLTPSSPTTESIQSCSGASSPSLSDTNFSTVLSRSSFPRLDLNSSSELIPSNEDELKNSYFSGRYTEETHSRASSPTNLGFDYNSQHFRNSRESPLNTRRPSFFDSFSNDKKSPKLKNWSVPSASGNSGSVLSSLSSMPSFHNASSDSNASNLHTARKRLPSSNSTSFTNNQTQVNTFLNSSTLERNDTSQGKIQLSLSCKTEIQNYVRSILRPVYRKGDISKDDYTMINKRVSRKLYGVVASNSEDRIAGNFDAKEKGNMSSNSKNNDNALGEKQENILLSTDWKSVAKHEIEKKLKGIRDSHNNKRTFSGEKDSQPTLNNESMIKA